MNPSESIDNQRISRALATLHKKVEDILKIAPNLMEINSLDELSKAKAKVAESKLWSIFAYGEYYVEKLMSDFPTPMLLVKSAEKFDYYRRTYKPISEKIRQLIDVSEAPTRREIEMKIASEAFSTPITFRTDIDEDMDYYESLALYGQIKNHIKPCASRLLSLVSEKSPLSSNVSRQSYGRNNDTKNSFLKIISAATDYLERRILKDEYFENDDLNDYLEGLESDLSDCDNVIQRHYFRPDDWIANEEELLPIFVTRDLRKIPTRIKQRVEEIYLSFTFGNVMSTIALSRCLLEYAIVERKSLLKIEVYFDNDKTRIRPLSNLISDTEKAFPELKASMNHIRKAGNGVMHPPYKKVYNLPPTKKTAKECVDGITQIISTLYSQ